MENELKKFYVDFYDMIDGWGGYGFFTERLFDKLEDAIELCDKLNSELPKSNKMCGEHFGIIDRDTKREIYCGMDKDYKLKMSEMVIDFKKMCKNDNIKINKDKEIMTKEDWNILEKYWQDQYDEDYKT